MQGTPTYSPRFGDLVSFNQHLPHKYADIPRSSGFSFHSITPHNFNIPSLTQSEIDTLLMKRENPTMLAGVTSSLTANHEVAGGHWRWRAGRKHSPPSTPLGVDLKHRCGRPRPALKFDKASQYASEIAGGVVVNWINPPPLSVEQQEWINAHFSRQFTWGMITSLYYASSITEHAGHDHTFTGSVVADVSPTTQALLNAALRGGYSLSCTAASIRSNAIAAYQLTPVHSSNTDERLPRLACWNCFGHTEQLPSVLKTEGYRYPGRHAN
jgi:hypothetical protein